jgi:glutamate formiminotransferase
MLECVVNVSEGRDAGVLAELSAASGAQLLDIHTDAIHNRSVFTLAVPDAEALDESVHALALRAVELIDLRRHAGVHPRLGVVDVVPFVPLGNLLAFGQPLPLGGAADLSDALAARERFVAWFAAQGVPCFEYGPERSLPEVRRRAWRNLSPSAGPDHPHETAGTCCVGARQVLVAYNVVLADGAGADTAKAIASELRGPALRVLGLDLDGAGQVSFNLVTPLVVGPAEAYDLVAARARIASAELVGLLPSGVLRQIPEQRWRELGLSEDRTIETRLAGAPAAAPTTPRRRSWPHR